MAPYSKSETVCLVSKKKRNQVAALVTQFKFNKKLTMNIDKTNYIKYAFS